MGSMQRWAAAAGLVAVMAAAPAQAKEVDVKVKDLQEVRLTRNGAAFVLALEVRRLGGPDLRLRSGTATVKVGDTRLPPIEVDFDGLKLEKGRPKIVKVPVQVTADSARDVAARRKAPALIGEFGFDDGDRDDLVQSFQLAGHQGAAGPRADQPDIEVIAARFGGEPAVARGAGAAIGGDPVAEGRGLADEAALVILGLHRIPFGDPFAIHEHVTRPLLSG